MGLQFLQNSTTSSRQIAKFWTWNKSRDVDTAALLIAQDDTLRIGFRVAAFQKAGRIYTNNSNDFLKACQDSPWNHDTSTLDRSETNGVAE